MAIGSFRAGQAILVFDVVVTGDLRPWMMVLGRMLWDREWGEEPTLLAVVHLASLFCVVHGVYSVLAC